MRFLIQIDESTTTLSASDLSSTHVFKEGDEVYVSQENEVALNFDAPGNLKGQELQRGFLVQFLLF